MDMVFHYIPFLQEQDGHATHVSDFYTITLDTDPIKRNNVLILPMLISCHCNIIKIIPLKLKKLMKIFYGIIGCIQ